MVAVPHNKADHTKMTAKMHPSTATVLTRARPQWYWDLRKLRPLATTVARKATSKGTVTSSSMTPALAEEVQLADKAGQADLVALAGLAELAEQAEELAGTRADAGRQEMATTVGV